MTGTNVGEALLVLGWMKLSLIFPPRRLINCKVLIQGKGSECLQEEWGVLEKSPEAALNVDQTIFVAVAEDVERSKTTVLWAARNFSIKKICLLYVHRLARPASCSENLLLLFLSDLTVLW
ncbi:hypothetical protein F2Q69_00048538 [Brassica cretica]|uniref:Uncharacterized protein n=1 Tax=Brassica cretica TaxID=69181 RepID=A0A8S9PUF4_BRACR|nr:hypothetical protein F2Q69_00048538 [Brassica cretica]